MALGEGRAWASSACPGETQSRWAPSLAACEPCLKGAGRGAGEDRERLQGAASEACPVCARASAAGLGEPSEVAPRGLQGVTACFGLQGDPRWSFLEGHFLLQKVTMINVHLNKTVQ